MNTSFDQSSLLAGKEHKHKSVYAVKWNMEERKTECKAWFHLK